MNPNARRGRLRLLREPDRGFSEDLFLFTERAVLAPQPLQLLADALRIDPRVRDGQAISFSSHDATMGTITIPESRSPITSSTRSSTTTAA